MTSQMKNSTFLTADYLASITSAPCLHRLGRVETLKPVEGCVSGNLLRGEGFLFYLAAPEESSGWKSPLGIGEQDCRWRTESLFSGHWPQAAGTGRVSTATEVTLALCLLPSRRELTKA